MDNEVIQKITGFDWDADNINKNLLKHNVRWEECEEVFFNEPLVLVSDDRHSQYENRYYVLGKTNSERKLFIVFTVREDRIRVISARDMNRKERVIYEKERNTQIRH